MVTCEAATYLAVVSRSRMMATRVQDDPETISMKRHLCATAEGE